MCGLLFRLSVVLLEKAFLEYCYGCFSSYLIAEYAFILLSNHRCNAFKCFCVTTYFNSLHFSEPVSYIVTDSWWASWHRQDLSTGFSSSSCK